MRKYILIIILFVTITYCNSLLNGFTGDDDYVVFKNNFIKSWHNFPLLFTKNYISNANDIIFNSYHNKDFGSGEVTYRPVVTLSYMVDYHFWKLDPLGYHLTNILLHCFNAIFLYIFVLLLVKNNLLALFTSLIFVTHPINTEVVNSVASREDLLVVFFLLGAFILFIRYKKYQGFKRKLLYIASCIAFFLATLSKETAIIFPLLIVLYDFLFESNRNLKNIISNLKSKYSGFIFTAIVYLYIYFFVFIPTSGFNTPYAGRTLYSHVLTSIKIISSYISAAFMPLNVPVIPPFYTPLTKTIFNYDMILSIVLLLFLLILVFRVYKYSKVVAFGISWFFIAILPTSNIFRLINMFSFRYVYFPAVGFCIVLAFLALKIANLDIVKKISLRSDKIIMLFTIGSYMAFTIPQNIFWRNDFTFGENQRMYFPNIAEPYQAISKYYFDMGRFDKAIETLRMSLKYTPISSSAHSLVYNSLGICYANSGETDKAIESFKRSVEIRPVFSDVYYNLGTIYLGILDFNKAIESFKKVVELDPTHADAYNNLGVAYLELKQYDDAKKAFEKALQISPDYELAKGNLDSIKKFSAENK